MPFEEKLLKAMDESARKAWDALSKYKFWMFGYHAGAWVRDNRFGGFKKPSPFKILVQVARAMRDGGEVTISYPPTAPSRRVAPASKAAA